MTFSISVIKEKADPELVLTCPFMMGLFRLQCRRRGSKDSPKVNIRYPNETLDILPNIDQKKPERRSEQDCGIHHADIG